MQSVKSRNTKPELRLRKMLFAEGYRYRLHARDLPGKPDIVFSGRKKIIFVHGCFWHGHGCSKGRLPKTNINFWSEKIARNMQRDKENDLRLASTGWEVLCVWECEFKHPQGVLDKTQSFLDGDRSKKSIDKRSEIE
jgi:DNA mismatch endonuclease (patch repair protein)